jgi:hypothetical protein
LIAILYDDTSHQSWIGEDNMPVKAPWWFWGIATLSLLWNAIGALDYTMTHMRIDSYMAAFTEEQNAYFHGFPIWAIACWALGVWGSLAGSLLLLLRRKWAMHAIGLSIIGLVGTTIYQLTSDIPDSLNTPTTWAFSAMIWLTTIGLFWFAERMRARRILR